MKKLFLLLSVFTLISCGLNLTSSNNSVKSNSNNVDYNLFDKNLIGVWYINSSFMGELELNTPFEIFDNYTLEIQNIKFNFVGLYENFEGTCKFISESGIMTFIASFDGEVVDWGFEDLSGRSDMGVARRTVLPNGYNYNYIGSTWPMEAINEYLSTEGEVPSYDSECYYLYSSASSLYENAKSCMIDIFDADEDAETKYIEALKKEGFSFQERDEFGFYPGFDQNHEYALRVKYFGENNLSIFIYNYETIFK